MQSRGLNVTNIVKKDFEFLTEPYSAAMAVHPDDSFVGPFQGINLSKMLDSRKDLLAKGAPAWESRTGGRLVSPKISLEKNFRPLDNLVSK